MSDRILIGSLNRFVDVIQETTIKNSAGESQPTQNIIARIKAMRQDKNGGESLNGKLINNNSVEYIVRRQPFLLNSGELLFISDIDGVYGITNISLTGQQSRFLKLECYKQDFNTPDAVIN